LLARNGINDGSFLTKWTDPSNNLHSGPSKGPLNFDWNFDETVDPKRPIFENGPLGANINRNPIITDCTKTGDPGNQTLDGFNDWDNLDFTFADESDYSDVSRSVIE
jgi:hypothetical protein